MSADKQKAEHELYLAKIQAEINYLQAQIARSSIERDKMQAETAKANVETAKADIEMQKVYKELKWYEIVIIISATLAVVAIVKLFL